jgi:superfamily II DNA or RNA helicase
MKRSDDPVLARRKKMAAKGAKADGAKRTPRTRKPEGMSVEQWQIALRREFGAEQDFGLKNLGAEPFFSEFLVTNPASGGEYRVAIRGQNPGDNYCSCPDFSVNTLGTCKHLEFALAKLLKRRGAKTAFAHGFQPEYSEVYLRYGAKREVAFNPGKECPCPIRDLASRYFGQDAILQPEAYSRFDAFLKAAAGKGHEVRCYADALGFIAQVRDEAARRERIDRAFPQGEDSPALADLLRVPLYPYQRKGALFAARAGRSLLADDMGLGKTIQAIAAVEILAREAGVERVLIICPTSLKHQWKDEIERFATRTALTVEGFWANRQKGYQEDSFYKITNYDVVHRDRDLIRKWSPDAIILDEAQRIKNWRTRTAQSVKALQSQFAIVLTGTPLENRLEELHSIVEFVDRYRLGPSFRFLSEHQQTDDCGRVTGYQNLSRISKTLEPILLRRSKNSVRIELPERMEKRFFLEMTPQQMDHHEDNRDIVARIAAKWRRYKFLSEADQLRLRIALQNMRMSCNSTYLLDQTSDHGRKADEAATLLEEIFERPGAKAVVFSQWLRTHEILARRFEGKGWPFVLFHGGVPGPKRRDLIKRFKEDPECRLFLSTDAGGVGLNLQNAEVVLNMDQPWNPAVLEQRIGRVHRLGQHRPVRVVHFVAEGTIEHGMLSLLSFKKSLFAGVLDGGEDAVFLGGTRLTKFMESVEEVSGAIPAPAPAEEQPIGELEAEEIDRERAGVSDDGPEGWTEENLDKEQDEELLHAMVEDQEEELAQEKIGSAGQGRAAEGEAAGEDRATECVVNASAMPPGAGEAFGELLSAGLSFLEKLGHSLSPPPADAQLQGGEAALPRGGPRGPGATVERDPTTGRSYVKLPLPDPDALQAIARLLAKLAGKG